MHMVLTFKVHTFKPDMGEDVTAVQMSTLSEFRECAGHVYIGQTIPWRDDALERVTPSA